MEISLTSSNSGLPLPFLQRDFSYTDTARALSEDLRFLCLKGLVEQALVRLSGAEVLAEQSPLISLPPCIEKADIIAAGLSLSSDVLEAVVRFPRLVVGGLLNALPELMNAGLAEEDETASPGVEIRSGDWVTQLFGTALTLMFLKAEACRNLADFIHLADVFLSDLGEILETDSAFTMALDEHVADRRLGQAWIMDGVEDSALRGPRRVTVTFDYLGLEYQMVALTGEQRHRLLRRYWKDGDLAAVRNDALLWGVRDRTDSRKPAFRDSGEIDAIPRAVMVDQLFAALLWISDFLPDAGFAVPVTPRDGECNSDLRFAMRTVGFTAPSPRPEESQLVDKRAAVALDWFWRHGKDWRRAPKIYGYICQSLKNAWTRWSRTATLEGDSEAGLGRKDGWRPIETTLAGPILDEIDVDVYHGAPVEIEHNAGVQEPAALSNDSGAPIRREPKWARRIVLEADLQRAFEALYGKRNSAMGRNWFPLPSPKRMGIGIPNPPLSQNRAALSSTSKRYLEVFAMRYLDGFDRKDFVGDRVALAGWRYVSPDRHGKEVVEWLLGNGYTRSELGGLAPNLIRVLGTEWSG